MKSWPQSSKNQESVKVAYALPEVGKVGMSKNQSLHMSSYSIELQEPRVKQQNVWNIGLDSILILKLKNKGLGW